MPSRAATRSAMDWAANASVPSGRWPPCCSTLPAKTTAVPLAAISRAASGWASRSISRSGGGAWRVSLHIRWPPRP